MVASYTPNLRLTLQGDNDNPNTWGQITNFQVISLIEEAVAGVYDLNVTGSSNIDLSATVLNGSSDPARHHVIEVTGVIGANIDIILPSVEKSYIFNGLYTGNYTVRLIPVGGSVGVDLLKESVLHVYTNGTNITNVTPELDLTPFMRKDQNLADLDDPVEAIENLGIMEAVFDLIYPVGSIYMNSVNNTNPGTLFGFGTWAATGVGRVLLGVGSTTDTRGETIAFTVGSLGGAFKHALSIGEMPAHSFNYLKSGTEPGGPGSGITIGSDSFTSTATNSLGNNEPHNNMQPYEVVYMWKRTA